MFLRWQLPRDWRLTFTLAKIVKVTGVDSTVGPSKHILMWDFDGVELDDVVETLREAQEHWGLPPIEIFSGRPNGESYHAYCFKLVSLQDMVRILSDTEGIDWGFLKWTVFRGHATLRIGPKDGYTPHKIMTLPSHRQPDINPGDLKHFVEYETLPRGRMRDG